MPGDITSNLIHHYKCDAGSGTTLLDSGSLAQNGTFGASTAAPTWVTPGMVGAHAISFDGNDTLALPAGMGLDNLAALSFAFCLKVPTGSADNGVVFGHFASGANYMEIRLGGAGGSEWTSNIHDIILFMASSNDGLSDQGGTASHPLTLDAWHRIVFSYYGAGATDADRVKLWIDGVPMTVTTTAGSPYPTTTCNAAASAAEFGSRGGALSLVGSLDDFRIYQRSLTDADVALFDVAPDMSANSNSVSVVEGTTDVGTFAATGGGPIGYSISGGADAAKFSIGASDGLLSFLTPPDYESPDDSGANRVYDVVILASNDFGTDDLTLAVTVTNDPADDPTGSAAAASFFLLG